MIITHKMKMELTRKEYSKCIDVMQDDKYSRKLQIELLENRRKFVPPIGCSVRIHFKKQDGLGGVYDTMPDGTKAWSIEENTVTIHLAPQVCCAPGDVEMVITLSLGATELHCFAIYLSVKPAMDRDIKSGNYNCIRGLLPQPDKAKSGDFLRVKSVDEYGRILTMEAVEMQEDDSADREVYILADGEAMDNVPESAEIIIDLSEEAPVYVKTVNGNKPDENGDVKIEVGGGSGGGVSSWNDLTDKPFDSETVTVDPNFDNDLTGRVVVPMANTVNLVKITDYVLTEEECIGASVSVVMGGQSSTLPITTTGVIDLTAMFSIPCFMATPDMFLEYGLPFVAVIKESGTVQGLEVSAGTYYVSESSMALYVSHFSALEGVTQEIVHKLDGKYLPDSVPYTEVKHKEVVPLATFAMDADGYGEVHDGVILTLGKTYLVTFNGVEYECEAKAYAEVNVYLGSLAIVSGKPEAEEGSEYPFGVLQWDDFTWEIDYPAAAASSVTASVQEIVENIHKLDEKYIPDTIARVSDIFGAMEASY